MAEEVADIMKLRARLQQAAGEFPTQIVEVKVSDFRLGTYRPPCRFDGTNAAARFVPEHVRVRAERFAGRIGAHHLENCAEPLSYGDDAQRASLRFARPEDQRSVPADAVDLNVPPLQR